MLLWPRPSTKNGFTLHVGSRRDKSSWECQNGTTSSFVAWIIRTGHLREDLNMIVMKDFVALCLPYIRSMAT